ncbi:5'-flap endonuclease [Mactra antiquata]
MSELKESDTKKKTKLSLSKKLPKFKRVKHNGNDKASSLFGDSQGLNETCDFRDASSFNKLKHVSDNKKNEEKEVTVISIKENSATQNDKVDTDSTVYHCLVCNKDLTLYNVQRRQQHVNRCVDKVEDTERKKVEEEKLIEKVRNAVLSCPMCGKNFKSEAGRVSHLKKCSRSNNVPTESLLQLVKDQEREKMENLAAGIIPSELRTKISKSIAPKKRKMKEPKNQYEEDVQVAMAMSSSMNTEQCTSSSNIVKGKDGRKKGKEKLEDVCLLTTLTDEDRQRRMEEKINTILHTSNNDQVVSSTSLFDSELKVHNDSHNLWNIGGHSVDKYDNEQFYVGTLIPPLTMSSGDLGKNLRRMSTIPGREKSFVDKNESVIKTMNTSTNNSVDDIISVSTQTALVLAQLATDDVMDTSTNQNVDSLKSTSHDIEASGFCVETLSLDKSIQESLVSETRCDYKKLINNDKYSDINIITCSGDRLYAHSVILMVRCPTLLKVSKDSTITIEYSTDVILTALRFIYTGEVIVTENSCGELKKLAEQYELPSLVSACDKSIVPIRDDIDSNDNVVNDEHEISVINVKDIWGESDSELDNDSVNNYDNDADNVNNDDVVCCGSDDDNNGDDQSTVDRMDGETFTDSEAMITVTKGSDDQKIHILENSANSEIRTENNVRKCASRVERKRTLLLNKSVSSKSEHSNQLRGSVDPNAMQTDVESYSPKHKKIRLTRLSGSEKISDSINVHSDFDDSIVLSDDSDVETADSTNEVDSAINKKEKLGHTKTKEIGDIRHEIIDSVNPAEVSMVESNHSYNIANSSADLFASPSPEKSNFTGIKLSMTLSANEQSCLDFSSPTSVNSLEKDNVNENVEDQFTDFKESVNCEISTSDVIFGNVGNVTDGVSVRIEDCNDNSGDDLEITGDNFDEIATPSPTFNRSLNNNNARPGSSQIRTKAHYLDMDIRVSPFVKKSLKIFDVNTVKIGDDIKNKITDGYDDHNNNDDHNDNDDFMVLEENEFDGDKCDDRKLINAANIESDNLDVSIDAERHVESYGSHDDEKEIINEQFEGDNEESGKQITSKNPISPKPTDISIQSYNEDVWDDFDDCGIGYEPPIVSPEPLSSPKSSDFKSEHEDVIDLSQNDIDDDICNDDTKQSADNIDFLQDGDDSFIFEVDEDKIDDNKSKIVDNKKTSFKTPTVSTKIDNKKKWIAPSPFTPMPKYNEMATPALKKELHKYGVKPVGKKRMLKMLEDIYQQTHQYETDSEIEDDDDVNSNDKGCHGNASTNISDDNEIQSHSDNSSQYVDFHDLMEESCLHLTTSDSDTSASPQKNVDVTKQLTNYMKSHSELHMKVLTFEPLELDVLKKNVKECGIKCSMDKLMDFLDERCIAFTTKNTRKNRVQKKAGKKKAKHSDAGS